MIKSAKLCIADPPYLGRAAIWYGESMRKSQMGTDSGGTAKVQYRRADFHTEASKWDRLEAHIELIETLESEFDGFALCMAADNLQKLLPYCKPNIRVMIWHKWSLPSRARVQNRYEPVLVRIPSWRKGATAGQTMIDVLKCTKKPMKGFTGSKPAEWTHWVLDAMGYQKGDEVVDLFNGSGAVAEAIESYVI